jgi:hypothetical protein
MFLIRRASLVIVTALLVVSTGDRAAGAQSADELAAVAKRYPGIDPRNTYFVAPANNDADYQPYFKRGTSELVVKPVFTLLDGTKTLCKMSPFETAYLYPRTPYTVWLVENWIFQLQKAGRNDILTAAPGQYFHQHLPTYLNDLIKGNVIRDANCDTNHEYVFHNLPVGKYVLFIYHVNFVEESHERYETQTIMTPDGPQNSVVPGSIEGASHVTDSYIDYGRGEVIVDKPSYRFTLDADDFPTILHFQEGHD